MAWKAKRLKTWHLERLVYLLLVGGVAALQAQPLVTPALAGDVRARDMLLATGMMLGALLCFASSASATDRLREKQAPVLQQVELPTVECVAVITRGLAWGRIFLALGLLLLHSWMAVASLAWDVLYPFWRAFYRRRWPRQEEDGQAG